MNKVWTRISDPTERDLLFFSIQRTEHYVFKIHIQFRCTERGCTTVHMYAGPSPRFGCFSLMLPFAMKNNYETTENVAHLCNLKRIRDCLHEQVTDEIWEKHSFAIEAMNRMIEILQFQFPYIKFITLEDDSQLECSANPLDKLDLLYYSVALYGKTWYEKQFDAYFIPKDLFISYKCNVRKFQAPETKRETSFEEIETFIKTKGSDEAYKLLNENHEHFKHLYNESNTFSEFFAKINNVLSRDKKCFMYKGWIKYFVMKFIGEIKRQWVINVYKFKGGRRRARKNKHPK